MYPGTYHAPNNVKVSDEGTVVGPGLADPDRHVCVDLGLGKGRVNFDASPSILEHVPLAGWFQKGDRVRSLYMFPSLCIRPLSVWPCGPPVGQGEAPRTERSVTASWAS